MRKAIKYLLAAIGAVAIANVAAAQMPAAQRIPPALEKSISLDAPPAQVWEYISDPANYKEFSRAKEFWHDGKECDSKIRLTTRKGSKRSQTIGLLIPEARRISYSVTQSDYPTDKQWFYGFEILPADNNNGSRVVMSVYFGFDQLPEAMQKALSQEFDDIAGGLKKKFK